MPANVESMFYVRETPWHGLGINVDEALNSSEALVMGGLDWTVSQKNVFTDDGNLIPKYKANIRESDDKVLGVVTDRYRVVQNSEAFAFTDTLLGSGVRYETAGSLQEGKKVWLLAKLPNDYIICGDEISPYLVFSNCHDGTGAIKICMTPIRVVCANTLNMALHDAKRLWTTIHTGNMSTKLGEAQKTLFQAEQYMSHLNIETELLNKIKLSDSKVLEYINELILMPDNASPVQERNISKLRDDMKIRYFDAPDLQDVGKNAYRFINAVSDFATHAKPLRETSTYKENMFAKTMDGNPLIDKAYDLMKAIA